VDTLTTSQVLNWIGPDRLTALEAQGLHPWHGLGPYSGQLVYRRREVKKALARAGTGRGGSKGGPLVPAGGRGGGYRVDVDGSAANHPGGRPMTATAAEGRAACGHCRGSGNCPVCGGTGERSLRPCLVCEGAGACPGCGGQGFRDEPAAWLNTGRNASTVTATGRQVTPAVERAYRRMLAAAERLIRRLRA
jgi:hypothetical protein